MRARTIRRLAVAVLVVAGLGTALWFGGWWLIDNSFDDQPDEPLAPVAVIRAEARLVVTCASPDYNPPRPEVAARQADVDLLIRALRRDPDTRFRFDDSDTNPQSLRSALAIDAETMRGGPCASLARRLDAALRALP